MISWQSRGRNAPSAASRLWLVVMIVLAVIGAVLAWVQHAGAVHLEGPLAFSAAALIAPLLIVQGVAVLRVALTWMAG